MRRFVCTAFALLVFVSCLRAEDVFFSFPCPLCGKKSDTTNHIETDQIWERLEQCMDKRPPLFAPSPLFARFFPHLPPAPIIYDIRTVRIYDVETGLEWNRLKGHEGGVSHVAFLPDGERVVTVSGGTVRIWNANSGRVLHKLEHPSPRGFWQVVISIDSKKIGTIGRDSTTRIWDTESGEELHKFEENAITLSTGERRFEVLSPDGNTLVTVNRDNYIRIRCVHSEMVLHQWTGYTVAGGAEISETGFPFSTPHAVNHIAFSPDGRKVIMGGNIHRSINKR